ncbi:MAG: hypothetical protein PHW83_10055, partial [Bacteroidales bacterium]|nr:hypothetical protein [Bacteroidales bacterium]
MEIVFLIVGCIIGFVISWLFFKLKTPQMPQLKEFEQKISELEKNVLIFESEKKHLDEQIFLNKEANQNLVSENKELLASLNVAETNLVNMKEKLDSQKSEIEEMQKKLVLQFENLANKILDEKSKVFTE